MLLSSLVVGRSPGLQTTTSSLYQQCSSLLSFSSCSRSYQSKTHHFLLRHQQWIGSTVLQKKHQQQHPRLLIHLLQQSPRQQIRSFHHNRPQLQAKRGRRRFGGKKPIEKKGTTTLDVAVALGKTSELPAKAAAHDGLSNFDFNINLGKLIRLAFYFLPHRYGFMRNRMLEQKAAGTKNVIDSISIRELYGAAGNRFFVLLASLFFAYLVSPYEMGKGMGVSMLPAIEPDASQVLLQRRHFQWLYRLSNGTICFPAMTFERGDLVTWSHPTSRRTALKRIIATEGMLVKRYGEFVHLYLKQDPESWGIIMPPKDEPDYAWIDHDFSWDTTAPKSENSNTPVGRPGNDDPHRLIEIPPGHVWIEGENPYFSLDSRQYGPIPIEFLHGKIVGVLWPIGRRKVKKFNKDTGAIELVKFNLKERMHPVPLTEALINRHGGYIVKKRRPPTDDGSSTTTMTTTSESTSAAAATETTESAASESAPELSFGAVSK